MRARQRAGGPRRRHRDPRRRRRDVTKSLDRQQPSRRRTAPGSSTGASPAHPAKLTLTDSTVASNTNGTASGVQSTGNTGNVVTVTRSTIALQQRRLERRRPGCATRPARCRSPARSSSRTAATARRTTAAARSPTSAAATSRTSTSAVLRCTTSTTRVRAPGAHSPVTERSRRRSCRSRRRAPPSTSQGPAPAPTSATCLARRGAACDAGAYEVDLPPDTSIDSGPTGTVGTSSVSFTFSSDDPGATFQCTLDGGAFTKCSSPQTYSNLADGAHTFSVAGVRSGGPIRSFAAVALVHGRHDGRRTRRSPAGRTAPRTSTHRHALRSPPRPARRSSASSTRRGRAGTLRRLHLAAGLHDAGRRRATRSPSAPATRPATPIRRRHPDVHGRRTAPAAHGRSGGPTALTNIDAPSLHVLRRGRTRRSSASSTARARRPARYATCTSPQALGALADGTYTFSVRATRRRRQRRRDARHAHVHRRHDRAGHDDHGGPTGTTNVDAPSFSVHRARPARRSSASSTARARRPARYATCTSPQALGPLADGTYTFSVRATDAAGNVDATPATRTFTVDTTAPDTTITAGRRADERRLAVVHVHVDRGGLDVRVQARRPGATTGTYATCTSPQAYGRAGRRRVHVLGPRDRHGRQRRRDAGHAHVHGRHDRAGHDDHRRPDGRSTSQRVVRVHQRRRDATFECKLDGPGAATGTYATCTSPRAYSTLADGTYTFSRPRDRRRPATSTRRPRLADVHGRHDRAGHDDHRRPDGTTNVTRRRSRSRRPRPDSTFECKLDGPGATTGTYASCTSPQALRPASPTAPTRSRVRATDAAGNVDATPATRTFTVDTTAPDTTITSGPTGATNVTSPSFALHSTEAGSTFECKLDGPGATTGTFATLHLAAGLRPRSPTAPTRSRSARPTPPATSTPTPATRTFTVDTTAPGHDDHRRPTGRRASPRRRSRSRHRGRLDVRVQARRPRRDHRHLRDLHVAAGLRPRWPTAPTRSRSARPTRPATSTRRPPRARSRSTPPRRTRRSPAARPAPTHGHTPVVHVHGARAAATFECKLDGPGATTGTYATLHVAAASRTLADGAYTFSRPRDRRGRQPATRPRDAHVHGRHARAGHDDHRRSRRARPTTRRRRSRSRSTKANSTFECKLDGPARLRRRRCTSPKTYAVARRRRATRSRSARPTRSTTRTRRPRRRRSRSTPRRRHDDRRRSRAARSTTTRRSRSTRARPASSSARSTTATSRRAPHRRRTAT